MRLPSKCWNLLHSLGFKSFHNSGCGEGALAWGPFCSGRAGLTPCPAPARALRGPKGPAQPSASITQTAG